MADSRDMNEQLRKLYTEHWEALAQVIPPTQGYSFPLLMDASAGYAASPVKVMVVGQQAFNWGGDEYGSWGQRELDAPLDKLVQLYRKFNRGENYVHSPFWVASHLLQRKLNPKSDPYGVMWSNLVRVDCHKERATTIEEALCRIPLLQEEVAIAKPHVVVFFTGTGYEERLKATFPAVSVKAVADYDLRYLARLVHPLLPYHSYRTYHPGYLKRKSLIEPIVSQIVQSVEKEAK